MFRGCELPTARLNFQCAPAPPSVLCRIGMGPRNSGAIRQSDAGHGARSDCALGESIVNPVVQKEIHRHTPRRRSPVCAGTLQGAGPAGAPPQSGVAVTLRPPKRMFSSPRVLAIFGEDTFP
mgnify:CR=1 FL=1